MKIIQIAETMAMGDGMGNHSILTHQMLRDAGFRVESYCTHMTADKKPIPVSQLKENIRVQPEDVILYQYGITGYCAELIGRLPGRKILCYHNVTTPSLIRPFDVGLANVLAHSTEEVRRWATGNLFEAVIAMSEYNRQDLLAMGYPRDKIYLSDYLIPFEDYEAKPDSKIMEKYSDGITNILFVGRIAPNKKHEDIIRCFAQYQKDFDPTARLLFVGGGDSPYGEHLQKYVDTIRVKNVTFCGRLSFPQIIAMYKTASVFLCMSEHEGFCIPLMEAMHFRVPVMAYACTAIPDTMNRAGVLLPTKHPVVAANWMHRLVTDKELRARVIEQQSRVVKRHSLEDSRARNLAAFQLVLDRRPPEDSQVLKMASLSGAAISGELYNIVNRNYASKGLSLSFPRKDYLELIHCRVPGL